MTAADSSLFGYVWPNTPTALEVGLVVGAVLCFASFLMGGRRP